MGILILLATSNVPMTEVFFCNAIDVIFPWIPNTLLLQYICAYWLLDVASISAICPDFVELAWPKTALYGAPWTAEPLEHVIVPAEKLPDASRLINVLAVLAVSIWADFKREISMVLAFKIAVILPAEYVKSISVLSVDDIAILASACARTDE